MKYKDWLKQRQYPYDPVRGNAVLCPDCGKLIGYDKDYMFMLITQPIVCPDCDEIVIFPTVVSYTADYKI